MTPQEKADKEFEVLAWMNRQRYDRRASKEVAPIIVKYLEDASEQNEKLKTAFEELLLTYLSDNIQSGKPVKELKNTWLTKAGLK